MVNVLVHTDSNGVRIMLKYSADTPEKWSQDPLVAMQR